jgi:hydroxyacylglutathione hydrolase
MIIIKYFTFNFFAENTYVLHDDVSKEAIIIDPGCYEKSEFDTLYKYIETHQLIPSKILNTHAHIDHVLGVEAIKNKYKIPFYLHPNDAPLLKSVKTYAQNYGVAQFSEPEIDHDLQEGDQISLGNSSLKVIFVPGHAPGHVAFVNEDQHFVIGGDVLFRMSIGRTDLPGGDHETLLQSIREKLFVLPDDYTVYAGHMHPTTIGFEKAHNPFF